MRLTLPITHLSSGLSETIVRLRDRMDTTSEEAVTGRYKDMTAHLSGRIGQAMLGQKAIDDVANERTQLTLKETRLEIIQQSLTAIDDNIGQLGVRMKSALGSEDFTARESVVRDAKAALASTFSVLNTRHGERYLFSGDATNTKPVGDVDIFLGDVRSMAASATDAADFAAQMDSYFNTPGSGWQANVYSGTATASDPASLTGIDPAITQTLQGLAVLALSGSDETLPLLNGNSDTLIAATETLADGQAALTNARAERGILQAQIESSKSALDLEETVLTHSFNQMTARDQYEAASELKRLETSLEASYTLTARLANLSLLNFMR
ncbi:flagellin [Hyphomonas adhaerens]|uniref:flagellin n=1 Tax=Hyphomonas adhaerens TaxID=81029 RepID=UPI002357F123|nr:flagellin [Hyphomonas adhaerens]